MPSYELRSNSNKYKKIEIQQDTVTLHNKRFGKTKLTKSSIDSVSLRGSTMISEIIDGLLSIIFGLLSVTNILIWLAPIDRSKIPNELLFALDIGTIIFVGLMIVSIFIYYRFAELKIKTRSSTFIIKGDKKDCKQIIDDI